MLVVFYELFMRVTRTKSAGYLLAARQPSPARTLLHYGPAQGTYSQGLMANGHVAVSPRLVSLGFVACNGKTIA